MQRTNAKNPAFAIELDDGRMIKGELYPRYAPQTCGNFISLANSGAYDGSAFHRVVPRFIAQGGRLKSELPYRIRGEFGFNGVRENRLTHEYGTLGMSRGHGYDSASSEFYIVATELDKAHDFLDDVYAPFGKVTEGMDIVEELASAPADEDGTPFKRIGIRGIRVNADSADYPFDRLSPDTTDPTKKNIMRNGE